MSILKGGFAGKRSKLRRRLLSLGNTFAITVQRGEVDSIGTFERAFAGLRRGPVVFVYEAFIELQGRAPRDALAAWRTADLGTYNTINLTGLHENLATTPVIPICTVVRNDFHELSNHLLDAATSTSETPFKIDTDMPVALSATSRALHVAAISSLARGFTHPRGALTTRAVTDASASRSCVADG